MNEQLDRQNTDEYIQMIQLRYRGFKSNIKYLKYQHQDNTHTQANQKAKLISYIARNKDKLVRTQRQ